METPIACHFLKVFTDNYPKSLNPRPRESSEGSSCLSWMRVVRVGNPIAGIFLGRDCSIR